jgi:hypothetical protein
VQDWPYMYFQWIWYMMGASLTVAKLSGSHTDVLARVIVVLHSPRRSFWQ